MKRYNLTVKILANVAVNATSAQGAKQAIRKVLMGAIQLADLPAFVVTGTEVTGVFDDNWDEAGTIT